MGLSMSAWGYSRLGFVTAERKDIVHDIFYCFFFISFFHYFIYFCSCISIPSPHGLNDSTTFFLSILFPYVVHSIRSHWMLHRYSPLESWLTDFDYWTLEPLVIAKPNPTRSRSRSIFNPSISSWRSRTFWCFHHVNIKFDCDKVLPKRELGDLKSVKNSWGHPTKPIASSILVSKRKTGELFCKINLSRTDVLHSLLAKFHASLLL